MAQSTTVAIEERILAMRIAFVERRYQDIIDDWHHARDTVVNDLSPEQRGEMLELAEMAGMARDLAEP